MRFIKAFVRLFVGVLPLGLTPLLGGLIAEGRLNFGGGDKDLLLLIPWVVWSLVYLVTFSVLWVRRFSPGRAVLWSLAASIAALFAMGVVLYLASSGLLGVKGN